MKLRNILIVVKDVGKSKQFYHDLFGLCVNRFGRNFWERRLFQKIMPVSYILRRKI